MTTKQQTLERASLFAVTLIALVAIVGLLVLVARGPAATGGQLVSAAPEDTQDAADTPSDENLAGDIKRRPSCPPRCER